MSDRETWMEGGNAVFSVLFPVIAVLIFTACVGISYFMSAGEAPIDKYYHYQTVEAQIAAGETPQLAKYWREKEALPTAEYYQTRTAELEATVQVMEAK